MRILVTGLIGQYAFGGVTWDYIQYVLGFRALGHDVWYLEDTGNWVYDPVKQEASPDCAHAVDYISRIMEHFDLGDRWIYRNAADGHYHGITDTTLAEKIIREADVLINVSGACWLTEVTAHIPRKLFLDGDPMFTQAGLVQCNRREYVAHLQAHDTHFTFGLNVGEPDCLVPTAGFQWRPTIQPVALDYWKTASPEGNSHPASGSWTTVMNWVSYQGIEFEGKIFGPKDTEFLKFIDLPRHVSSRFVIAMGQGIGQKRPTEMLEEKGWNIVEPDEAIPDFASYHDFLHHSRAEWSIAKHGYVAAHTGWFSCRSACYLALGRPVVVQDTGWSRHLPSGAGVLSFTNFEEAVAAIEDVEKNYASHSRAAREFAQNYLEAAKVCDDLLN